jgi:excisionase family DNA binding protein
MDDVLYTVSEVSKLIKTNPAYVYELIKAGHLPVLKLGSMKIRKAALDHFLEKNEGNDLTNPFDVRKIELVGDQNE